MKHAHSLKTESPLKNVALGGGIPRMLASTGRACESGPRYQRSDYLRVILAGVVEKSDAEPFTTVSRVSMREKRRAVLSGLRPMKASTLKAEVRTDFAFCYVAVWSFFALQLRYFER